MVTQEKEKMFKGYNRLVMSIVFRVSRRTGESWEDLMQEAYLIFDSCLRKWDQKLYPDITFGAYFKSCLRALYNPAKAHIMRAQTEIPESSWSTSTSESETWSPFDTVGVSADIDYVQPYIQCLNPVARQIAEGIIGGSFDTAYNSHHSKSYHLTPARIHHAGCVNGNIEQIKQGMADLRTTLIDFREGRDPRFLLEIQKRKKECRV